MVPEKSWVYPIEHVWIKRGDVTLESASNLDINFTVKNSVQETKPLQLVSPDIAKETLGVFIAPNGSRHTQIEYFKKKSFNMD